MKACFQNMGRDITEGSLASTAAPQLEVQVHAKHARTKRLTDTREKSLPESLFARLFD